MKSQDVVQAPHNISDHLFLDPDHLAHNLLPRFYASRPIHSHEEGRCRNASTENWRPVSKQASLNQSKNVTDDHEAETAHICWKQQ